MIKDMKSLIAILLVMSLSAATAQDKQSKRMPENVAIWAVQARYIDPIVRVHYGGDQRFKTHPSLNDPLGRNPTKEDYKRLENLFLNPGTLISVFSGGEKLGTATVREGGFLDQDGGCMDLHTGITYNGPGNPLLAANTTTEIQGHISMRRVATSAETSILRNLAIEWMTEYGLDRQLLQQATVGQVTSTILRKEAGYALIGRFDVISKRSIHRLFAVAEKVQEQYTLTLANLDIQCDVEDGTDRTEWEYIDQLDVDNNGIDELITSSSHYESWNYAVWRFSPKGNYWYKAYEGGGGGC